MMLSRQRIPLPLFSRGNMKPVLSASEMKSWDTETIRELGVPSAVLMERAALAIAETVVSALKTKAVAKKDARILCVCGTGNNGGDGAACARILTLWGYRTSVCLVGSEERFSDDMTAQMAIVRKLGIDEVAVGDFSLYDVIVDAIFGIGLSRAAEDRCGAFKAIAASKAYVISADIPSGINADNGHAEGVFVEADETVTMQAVKVGHLLYPGTKACGTLKVADIGIRPLDGSLGYCLDAGDLSLIPPRDPHGHKGTFGKVLVIAGSHNMSGAALMTCEAALRSGCGMVKLLTCEENRVILQERLPEVMLETYTDAESAIEALDACLEWADVVACGPGLGRNETVRKIVNYMLAVSELPLILDADGLNALEGRLFRLSSYGGLCVVTPHPSEMSRLTGKPIKTIADDPISVAAAFSRETGVVCLLKDARTIIMRPDGKYAINTTGNSGMATAGSGDVLTGIVAGLAARDCPFEEVAALASYIHGRAGDLASEKYGESGIIATDMIKELSKALGE